MPPECGDWARLFTHARNQCGMTWNFSQAGYWPLAGNAGSALLELFTQKMGRQVLFESLHRLPNVEAPLGSPPLPQVPKRSVNATTFAVPSIKLAIRCGFS